MNALHLPDALRIAHVISSDIQHRLAVAVYAAGPQHDRDRGGWAWAALRTDTGEVLAWDGWYFDPLAEEQREPLASLDFDDFDDMPSKLLADRNATWLGGPLAHFLMPHYSFARVAAHMVWYHGGDEPDANQRRGFGEGDLVAYFPVAEESAVIDRLEYLNAGSRSFASQERNRQALETVRAALRP